MSSVEHRTCPVVLSAPSGAGKTTIARALVKDAKDVVFSVSVTTRPAREHEVDGVDYEFLSEQEFREMIEADHLVEWAEVHGHLYGTSRQAVQAAYDNGSFLILDVDVQGAMQMRERVPDAVLVFVLPPSAAVLVERLTGRGTEGQDTLIRRIENARGELEHASEFDYIVVNDDLDRAIDEVRGIVLAEGRRRDRAIDLSDAIRQLQGQIDLILEKKFGISRR
ncbi:MAG TPA: guanylate kinase [Gemmatimonadetes bacterium]|nr:guanylate kinase [Gemmatimonadota bacterium]